MLIVGEQAGAYQETQGFRTFEGEHAAAPGGEDALRRSLELEPDSQTARNELGDIEDLRRKRDAGEEDVPWYLHSLINSAD